MPGSAGQRLRAQRLAGSGANLSATGRLRLGCWRRRRVNPIATGKLVDWELSRWTISFLSALEGRADVAYGADEESWERGGMSGTDSPPNTEYCKCKKQTFAGRAESCVIGTSVLGSLGCG